MLRPAKGMLYVNHCLYFAAVVSDDAFLHEATLLSYARQIALGMVIVLSLWLIGYTQIVWREQMQLLVSAILLVATQAMSV